MSPQCSEIEPRAGLAMIEAEHPTEAAAAPDCSANTGKQPDWMTLWRFVSDHRITFFGNIIRSSDRGGIAANMATEYIGHSAAEYR